VYKATDLPICTLIMFCYCYYQLILAMNVFVSLEIDANTPWHTAWHILRMQKMKWQN